MTLKISYPVFTVVVFAGSPTSDYLKESYRRTFDTAADAIRYAARTVSNPRTDFAGSGRSFIPPCASVFEDSPSRGIGKQVAERVSNARRWYLTSLAKAVPQA